MNTDTNRWNDFEEEHGWQLIKDLLTRINDNNRTIVSHITSIIILNEIHTLDELLWYEENKITITIDDKKLNTEEKVEYCIGMLNPIDDCEWLELEDIQVYRKYIEVLYSSESSLEDRLLSIIIIFCMTHRVMYFPYEAYMLIMNSRI